MYCGVRLRRAYSLEAMAGPLAAGWHGHPEGDPVPDSPLQFDHDAGAVGGEDGVTVAEEVGQVALQP